MFRQNLIPFCGTFLQILSLVRFGNTVQYFLAVQKYLRDLRRKTKRTTIVKRLSTENYPCTVHTLN